jgi:hypothetical protein
MDATDETERSRLEDDEAEAHALCKELGIVSPRSLSMRERRLRKERRDQRKAARRDADEST